MHLCRLRAGLAFLVCRPLSYPKKKKTDNPEKLAFAEIPRMCTTLLENVVGEMSVKSGEKHNKGEIQHATRTPFWVFFFVFLSVTTSLFYTRVKLKNGFDYRRKKKT
jgi:hypothetical protein